MFKKNSTHLPGKLDIKFFLSRVFSPSALGNSKQLETIAEESFNEVIRDAKTQPKNIPQKGSYQNNLSALFREIYYNKVLRATGFPDITNDLINSLLRMNQNEKDYVIWHYVNKFTTDDICSITGSAKNIVRARIFEARYILTEQLNLTPALKTLTRTSERQFQLLLDYFETPVADCPKILPTEASLNETMEFDKALLLELFLRYKLDKNLLPHLSREVDETALSADDFLKLVKKNLEF